MSILYYLYIMYFQTIDENENNTWLQFSLVASPLQPPSPPIATSGIILNSTWPYSPQPPYLEITVFSNSVYYTRVTAVRVVLPSRQCTYVMYRIICFMISVAFRTGWWLPACARLSSGQQFRSGPKEKNKRFFCCLQLHSSVNNNNTLPC